MPIDYASQGISKKNKSPNEKRELWLSHLKNWKESGLSKAEYCRRANIKYSHFRSWEYRLKKKAMFLPVRLLSEKVLVERSCGIEIRGPGIFSIILKGEFEESLLKKAIRSLWSSDV